MLTQWFAELPARKSLHWDQGVSAKLLSSLPRVLQALSQASHALPSILTPCSLSRIVSIAFGGAQFCQTCGSLIRVPASYSIKLMT